MDNQLPKKYDPSEWQYQDAQGKIYKISDLSREDLMQVACDGMDALEQIDSKTRDLAQTVEDWRSGNLLRNLPQK